MHDIVTPAPVPWWPPAPGWYVVFAVLFLVASFFAWRFWRQWRANAYRREALRELRTATTAAAISELLRRTALAIAPRTKIAGLEAETWTDWLAEAAPVEMPGPVRHSLIRGPYDPASTDDVAALREFAGRWIKEHKAKRTRAD